MNKFFLCLFIIFFLTINCFADTDLALHSKSAILVESTTGKILFEKNINEKRSPASMTKIMTLLITMEALESNKIKLDDKVLISKNASSMGGTQIFVKENTYVTVNNLLKGIGIASANDAAVAMAEYIGGSEENFVSMMNKKATELGCKNTNFMNPHGLDEKNHYTTAYDLSLIARELVNYPLAIKITSTYEDYIDVSGENHWLVNTNKLVKFYNGIDGLKTGYTDNALYCLTATMKKNDMRLISIVMGSDTKDNRSSDTIAMMQYGYSMYGSESIIKKDEYDAYIVIDNAYNKVNKYTLEKDVNLIVDKSTVDVHYDIETKLMDVKAPIKKGEKIGTLYLKYNNMTYEYNLITKNEIKETTYIRTISNMFKDILSGTAIKW